MIGMIGSLGATRIYEDINAAKILIRVRGYPAAHHPNRNRPYYRKVKVIKPLMYFAKELNYFICHPAIAQELRRRFSA